MSNIDLSIDLSSRFLKVACPIHMAGNSKQLKEVAAEVEISKGAQVGKAVKASKQLIADEYLVNVKKAKNAIKSKHDKLTSVWNDSSWRLLPTHAWFDYANTMNPLIAEFDAAADELASKFDQALQEAEYRLGDLYDRADYPDTESEFRGMFRAEVQQEPLPQLSDASRISLPVAELDAMRQGMEKAYQSNIHRVKGEVFERLHDATSALAASLKKWEQGGQKSVKATLLETIKGACAYAQQFNVDGDSRITALLDDVQACVAHDMDTIRENPSIRAQVISAATDAADKSAQRKKAMANMAGYMQ